MVINMDYMDYMDKLNKFFNKDELIEINNKVSSMNSIEEADVKNVCEDISKQIANIEESNNIDKELHISLKRNIITLAMMLLDCVSLEYKEKYNEDGDLTRLITELCKDILQERGNVYGNYEDFCDVYKSITSTKTKEGSALGLSAVKAKFTRVVIIATRIFSGVVSDKKFKYLEPLEDSLYDMLNYYFLYTSLDCSLHI